jgi:hypothetical protein
MRKTGFTVSRVFSIAFFPVSLHLHVSDNEGFSTRPPCLMTANDDCCDYDHLAARRV